LRAASSGRQEHPSASSRALAAHRRRSDLELAAHAPLRVEALPRRSPSTRSAVAHCCTQSSPSFAVRTSTPCFSRSRQMTRRLTGLSSATSTRRRCPRWDWPSPRTGACR
jgi:hypothetical protein